MTLRFAAINDTRYTPHLTRRAMAVLSTPTSGFLNNAEMTFRVSNVLPSTTTRWRLRIRNYRVLSESATLVGASFTGLYHGEQALDSTGLVTGGYVNAPTQALGAFTLPSDGSEYISSWVTASNAQITGSTPWLFSFAYTGGGTSNGQANGQGQCWYVLGAGSSSNIANQAAAGFTTTGAVPFDIRIEYEATTEKKVGLFVGDSITFSTASAVISQQNSFPMVYARKTGNQAANAGIPSVTALQWGTSTDWKWQRFDPANVTYDFAVIALGTNDISGNVTLANLKTYFLSVVTILRGLGIKNIYGCTITPRNLPHGRLAVPAAAAATSIICYEGGLSAGNVQIGDGLLAEARTTSGTPTDNGNGTFTYTITAGLTNAHKAGEVMALSQETVRLGFNSWLGGMPGNLTGVIRHDRAMAARWDQALMHPDFAQTDNLHPSLSGCVEMANLLPAVPAS